MLVLVMNLEMMKCAGSECRDIQHHLPIISFFWRLHIRWQGCGSWLGTRKVQGRAASVANEIQRNQRNLRTYFSVSAIHHYLLPVLQSTQNVQMMDAIDSATHHRDLWLGPHHSYLTAILSHCKGASLWTFSHWGNGQKMNADISFLYQFCLLQRMLLRLAKWTNTDILK